MAHEAKADAASPEPQDDSKQEADPNIKLAQPPKMTPKHYRYEGDPVLTYAWELYETYSGGSGAQKRENTSVRRVIIMLIFLTSTLAVFGMLPGVDFASGFLFGALAWLGTVLRIGFFVSFAEWLAGLSWSTTLSVMLIVLSVATTAMLSYANQFTPMKAWIMYRVGADRIRSEIYLYRLKAGRYKDLDPESEDIRTVFLRQIEAINRQIYELETAPPFLQMMEQNKRPEPEPSGPRRLYTSATAPFRWVLVRPWQWLGKLFEKRQPDKPRKVLADTGEEVPRRMSGRYYPEHDHGFNKLTGQDYINYRAIPQRDWYVEKVYEDYEKIKDWRRVLLTVGGASAVLAVLQKEPFIVVTTAATVAINTHLQLNLIGSTYGNYHLTASRLDSELIRWRNSANPESREEVARLVETIESVLEDERSVWMQQASQAQKETEQTLIKGAGKRDGGTIIEDKYLQEDYGLVRVEDTTETKAVRTDGSQVVAAVTPPRDTTTNGTNGDPKSTSAGNVSSATTGTTDGPTSAG